MRESYKIRRDLYYISEERITMDCNEIIKNTLNGNVDIDLRSNIRTFKDTYLKMVKNNER